MDTDLFTALLDKENQRGHPILAALVYAFCPAAARWWLAGADPRLPFDPLWQALEDLVSGGTLKAALSSYGFEDLLDVAQSYVDQVDAWRNRHPGIRAPEWLPTFPGGRIEMSRRFGQRLAIGKFGDRWENFFAYVRAWAFVAPDWEARMRFSEPPQFSQIRLAFMQPGLRRPAYFPAWSWLDPVKKARRVVLGLIVAAKTQDQLRLGLAWRANPVGDQPWPARPEVWALEWESGGAGHFERHLPTDQLPQVVAQLAQAAKAGPHPPLAALRGSGQCARCGFRAQCYAASGEISPLALSPQVAAHSHDEGIKS
jgi:hypothetical protein